MTPLARLTDDQSGISVLAPDGWKLLASVGANRLRLHRKGLPPNPRKVFVFDIFYDGLATVEPPSTPAIDALRSYNRDAQPRVIGEWACCEEREGDDTFASGVRAKDGTFLSLYFHGPTGALADMGGLEALVRIAESAEGLRPRGAR